MPTRTQLFNFPHRDPLPPSPPHRSRLHHSRCQYRRNNPPPGASAYTTQRKPVSGSCFHLVLCHSRHHPKRSQFRCSNYPAGASLSFTHCRSSAAPAEGFLSLPKCSGFGHTPCPVPYPWSRGGCSRFGENHHAQSPRPGTARQIRILFVALYYL